MSEEYVLVVFDEALFCPLVPDHPLQKHDWGRLYGNGLSIPFHRQCLDCGRVDEV